MKLSTSGKQYDIRFQRSQFNANKLYFWNFILIQNWGFASGLDYRSLESAI